MEWQTWRLTVNVSNFDGWRVNFRAFYGVDSDKVEIGPKGEININFWDRVVGGLKKFFSALRASVCSKIK